ARLRSEGRGDLGPPLEHRHDVGGGQARAGDDV
ncbi:uncharacterized protein METZ01_LOCUS499353, partial [marine metagenome]